MHFSLTCIQPILTVYVSELAPSTNHLAVISGAVFSSAGFASMLFASKIGHLSDRIGAQKVLPACLLLAGLVSLPQGLSPLPGSLLCCVLSMALRSPASCHPSTHSYAS